MGVNDREQDKRDAKRKAAQTKNSYRDRRHSRGTGADWSEVEAAVILDAIATVARTGGALRFGYTSDGGAYSVGVLGDGEPYTLYVAPNEDVAQELRDLTEYWKNAN